MAPTGDPRPRRRATIALLLLAPAIPELLTGSTPITNLVLDPVQFAVSFLLDVGLYGTGALLIREFAVAYRKGWPSILLLGAAYGIAEEGLAVHTFFQRSGNPVGTLGTYGHAFGVNWLWALGLTVFHATYSIALPILLVGLWYPAAKEQRWFGRRGWAVVGTVYVAEVVVFGVLVGHGPSPAALAFLLAVIAVLAFLAVRLPRDLLRLAPGPAKLGRVGLVLLGTLGFDAWALTLIFAGVGRWPALAAGLVYIGIDAGALALVLRRVGSDDLERSEYYFATGMLLALWVWDVPVEFRVPGILGVAAVFVYLQWRLGRRIRERSGATRPPVPDGAVRGPTGPG